MASSKKPVAAPAAEAVPAIPVSKPAAKKVAAKKAAPTAAKTAAKTPAKTVAKTAAKAATKAPAKAAPAKAAPKKAKPPTLDVAQRAHYIEVAAFYIAERRGFAPGNPEQDYLDAAAEIDRMLAAGHFY